MVDDRLVGRGGFSRLETGRAGDGKCYCKQRSADKRRAERKEHCGQSPAGDEPGRVGLARAAANYQAADNVEE
jgi:hypothetical protein